MHIILPIKQVHGTLLAVEAEFLVSVTFALYKFETNLDHFENKFTNYTIYNALSSQEFLLSDNWHAHH